MIIVFGAGSIVFPKVKIGSNVKVRAGVVVTDDVQDNSKIVGNHAKLL